MVETLTALGLGLDYGTVRLKRTAESWVSAGLDLRDRTAGLLGPLAACVEQIGSSSVLGLLAKPIIDLAAGVAADQELKPVRTKLTDEGWIYRGDAGTDGGQVFVLEARRWHRVAHLHVVTYGGDQWLNYLRLRDWLRRNPEARSRYEAAKLKLASEHATDHRAYTAGKRPIVTALLTDIA